MLSLALRFTISIGLFNAISEICNKINQEEAALQK